MKRKCPFHHVDIPSTEECPLCVGGIEGAREFSYKLCSLSVVGMVELIRHRDEKMWMSFLEAIRNLQSEPIGRIGMIQALTSHYESELPAASGEPGQKEPQRGESREEFERDRFGTAGPVGEPGAEYGRSRSIGEPGQKERQS